MSGVREGRVLILEDDPGIARLERSRLERAGFAAESASNPEAALERIERGGIDLLVLDYRLKGERNGLDFHTDLRALGWDIPSILVTGFSDDALLTEAIRAGIRDFLPKTEAFLDYLGPTVDRVLTQVRTERELAAARAEMAALADRARYQEELRDSEARFQQLADAMPHVVWACKPDGSCDYWNSRASTYFGVPTDTLLDWNWREMIHADDQQRAVDTWLASVRSGTPYEVEYRLKVAGGGYRWNMARGLAFRDASGAIARWFGTCTDIDDRKRMEAELRNQTDALRDADRRKDEFLAMLAHELRNPLSAINNAVELSRRSDDDSQRRWSVEVIQRQVEHLSHLVDDLLDVARITRGKIALRVQRLVLQKVVDRAVESVRSTFARRGHELSVTIPDEPIHLIADPTRLEQVIVNLLTNSAKYTDPGGHVSFVVACRDHFVELRVRDDGVGIPAEMLPHIFQPFIQVDRSLDRSQGGLGIGLTLVKSIVELHGGTVSATSEGQGLGSEFVVSLPIAGTAEMDGRAPNDRPRRREKPQIDTRVLIVDDNRDSASALGKLLGISGYRIEIAHDGPEAVTVTHQWRPNVVLLDIGLPGMDGFQVARLIRSTDPERRIRLIAVSGYGRDDDRTRSRESGIDYHMVKPIDFDELLHAIAEPVDHLQKIPAPGDPKV